MAEAVSLYPIEPAEPLEVRPAPCGPGQTAPGQFWIEGRSPGRHWDDQYVNFSGYYGSYGPHVFAAAPDLLAALKAIVSDGCMLAADVQNTRQAMAAITKAEGRS